jgi:protein TonB
VNAMLHPSQLGPYGAAELKAVARAHLSRALAVGSGAWILLFALAAAMFALIGVRPIVTPRLPTIEIGRLPTLVPPLQPAPPMPSVARIKPGAIPNPVDRVDTPPEAPPPPARPTDSGSGAGKLEGNPVTPGAGAVPEAPPPPEIGVYVPHDVEPAPIEPIRAKYPEFAQLAGVEGTVYVLALVDRDGAVVRAIVRRSVPTLDEAALEGVRRARFTPALADGHPVAVWVAVPVRFSLH